MTAYSFIWRVKHFKKTVDVMFQGAKLFFTLFICQRIQIKSVIFLVQDVKVFLEVCTSDNNGNSCSSIKFRSFGSKKVAIFELQAALLRYIRDMHCLRFVYN